MRPPIQPSIHLFECICNGSRAFSVLSVDSITVLFRKRMSGFLCLRCEQTIPTSGDGGGISAICAKGAGADEEFIGVYLEVPMSPRKDRYQ